MPSNTLVDAGDRKTTQNDTIQTKGLKRIRRSQKELNSQRRRPANQPTCSTVVRDVKGVRTAILIVVVVIVVVQRDAEVGARRDAEEVVILRLVGIPVQHGSDRVLCKRASEHPTNQPMCPIRGGTSLGRPVKQFFLHKNKFLREKDKDNVPDTGTSPVRQLRTFYTNTFHFHEKDRDKRRAQNQAWPGT